MRTYPNLLLKDFVHYSFLRRIRLARLLNYLDYDKEPAKAVLKARLGWRDYGDHHAESIYTRFFQYYLAPLKFDQDRRKVTLSAMVRRGLLTRDHALARLRVNEYLTGRCEQDKRYIASKLGLSLDAFEEIIARPKRSVHDYRSYLPLIAILEAVLKLGRKRGVRAGIFQGGRFST